MRQSIFIFLVMLAFFLFELALWTVYQIGRPFARLFGGAVGAAEWRMNFVNDMD